MRAGTAGAAAVNGAVSVGNALLHDPLAAGGLALGAAGVVAGGALALAGGSVSGTGAAVGVPVTGPASRSPVRAGRWWRRPRRSSRTRPRVDRVEPLPTGGPLSAEEKDAAVRGTVFDEAGNPGSDPGIREVGAEQFGEIEDSVPSPARQPGPGDRCSGQGPGRGLAHRTRPVHHVPGVQLVR